MNYQVKKHSDRLFQILMTPPIEGFDHFICTWIYRGSETFIVDPGPAVTVGTLLSALAEIGLKTLDYILLTHIHIDHSGGVAEVAEAFPGTPVICHDKARPHLVDPERLWQGTLKTLGDIGRAYGKIEPVATDRLISAQEFSTDTIQPFLTPGHAPHHVSYLADDVILFAGEAGGVHTDFDEAEPYLRPATPPKFFMETSIASIDLLIEQQPRTICYGHTTMKTDAVAWLKKHREQLPFWKNIIAEESNKPEENGLVQRCAERLIQTDPLMKGLSSAPALVLQREQYFIQNSIKGFIGYLDIISEGESVAGRDTMKVVPNPTALLK